MNHAPFDDVAGDRSPVTPTTPQVVRHLAGAVAGHVRRLAQQGLEVPQALTELNAFLVGYARTRQHASHSAHAADINQDSFMPERLLVTKVEAAERLSVSVRTVERLVARGRLAKVHIDGAVRFRVKDLEDFVDGLDGSLPAEPESDGRARFRGTG